MDHVLIVEDHEENRALLKLLLEANAYRVTAAGDGLEALATARRDPPDVVVSDVLLPRMDGFALCRAWMQDAALRAIPFIFYSATYVRPDDERFAMALGAVRYLIKPLEMAVFLRELRAVLQQWAGHAAPGPAAPLDDVASHALHESALARKLEDKMAQLEAANRRLQQSEARFRSLTEMSSDFYWESDAEHRFTQRESAGNKSGTIPEFERGAHIDERRWDMPYPAPDETGWAAQRALLDARRPFREFELSRLDTDGTERFISISGDPVFDASGAFTGYHGVGSDITERRRAEDALRASEERFRATFEQAAVGIAHIAPNGRWLRVNRKLCDIVGYTREEFLARTFEDITHPDDLDRDREQVAQLVAMKTSSYNVEKRYLHKNGGIVWINITVALVRKDSGMPDYFISVIEDISARKRAEQELLESEERFRGLVEQSITGIFMIQDGKFAYVNPRVLEITGRDRADELIGRDALSIVAEQDRALVAQHMRERIVGAALRSAYEFTVQRADGSLIEVGVHGTRATYHGRPAILGLMQDISEKKRAEQRIQRYVAELETAFMSTVEVATTLSEMRDPYTAGHERRVAEIAVAIGAKLGLDARRQEGLRVAGHLHDVGKITIPAEILSKPSKLNPIEFQLIQVHPRAGYDVLKDVKFPWPVAEVALQHHERIDGSGYPQGLKGEAILLEARIIAVADVIEAMSSHRPYRPGLGIDKALTEIERGRGSAYDADVADACLQLFRADGYQLPA